MNDPRERLRARCIAALREYRSGGGEASLQAGYELGREALELGLGVLDLTAITHAALMEIAGDEGGARGLEALAEAEPFLLECYSPFEMAHRGAHESNAALGRIVQAREEENRRLALELHDQASQMLAAVHLALDEVAGHVAPAGHAPIEKVREHLRTVERQLRRISHEMRPPMLDDLGLVPALRFLGEGLAQRTGLKVRVEGELESRPPAAVELTLYRAAQEALHNVIRHARATRAALHVAQEGRLVTLRVRDDGVGFAAGNGGGAGGGHGLGLRGVRDRLAAVGGALEIRSETGRGAEIRIAVPWGGVEHVAHSAGR